MSVLESIESGLDSLSTFFDILEEDAKGAEGRGNAASDRFDKVKEMFKGLAKLFTALDQQSWWDFFKNITESIEELVKVVAKALGGFWELALKILAKVISKNVQFASAAIEIIEE